MLEIKKDAIERMCVALEGTDASATHYQKEHGLFPLTDEEQELMDSIIFQCPDCGWWCKTQDMVDGLCEDCYLEELEEEEDDEDGDDDE